MAKNKQRRTSYYANGREHAKTLNAFFRVNNYRGRRWHNSGEYLRGLSDGLKIELKTNDPTRLAHVLWYIGQLPSTVKGHVISKTGVKLDKWGMPSLDKANLVIDYNNKVSWYKPTFVQRVKDFCRFLFKGY